jgi:hypothetical protein
MKIPAAMARSANTGLSPLKAGISVTKPQRMSKIASKNMPMFFVNLLKNYSFLYKVTVNRMTALIQPPKPTGLSPFQNQTP